MRPFTVFILLFVASCLFLSRPVFADDVVKPVIARLVAKGEGYLVHVLPRQYASPTPPPIRFGLKKHFGVPIHNAALTHTSTKTGKMQYLFVSGRHTASGIPMGITVMHHLEWRLLGVSVSSNRIYLATWRSVKMTTGGTPVIPKNGKGTYEVSVFNASDGTKLASHSLPIAEMPQAPPPESCDQGQLSVKGDEIWILNQKLKFDGKQLRPAK